MVKSFEVGRRRDAACRFTHSLRPRSTRPFYVRVRGTDGNRTQAGFHGAAVDPVGPMLDVVGNADPWGDLWFYANPDLRRPSLAPPFRADHDLTAPISRRS